MQFHQSKRVLEARSTLQQKIRDRMRRDNVTPEQLAEKLGLLPIGAEVLLARDNEWTLDTAFRVAEAVGLEVTVSLGTSGG